MNLALKHKLRQKRIWRIRKKVRGTAARPRLCVHFSNLHIYAQLINDDTGVTVFALGTQGDEGRAQKLRANKAGATALGQMVASGAKAAGITKVVFDRNGRLYHGCVKAFADAARAGGLEF